MIPYKGADTDYALEGKTAIITGGAAGIGYATAEFFSKKNVNLVLADLNPNVDNIAKKFGPKNIGVQGDVCDTCQRPYFQRAALLCDIVEAFDRLDIDHPGWVHRQDAVLECA